MKDIDRKDIDILLKMSLTSSDKPSEQLNQELKANIRLQNSKGKSISIWWIPMCISIFITIISSIIAFLYIPYGILQMGVMVVGLLTMTFSIALTTVGVKYFELKKGAVICL